MRRYSRRRRSSSRLAVAGGTKLLGCSFLCALLELQLSPLLGNVENLKTRCAMLSRLLQITDEICKSSRKHVPTPLGNPAPVDRSGVPSNPRRDA